MLLDEGDGLVDLEDLGKVMVKAKTNSAAAGDGAPKEMLTTSLRKSLTKQVSNFADLMFSFGLVSFQYIELDGAIQGFPSFEATLNVDIEIRKCASK